MAALTKDRDTRRRDGDLFGFEAGGTIFAGAMVALDAAGKLVPASASGTIVVGVAQHGAKAGDGVRVRRGVFNFTDAGGEKALTRADVGTVCYAADDQTVQKEAGTPAAPVAGLIMDVDGFGVWVKI